MEQLLNMFWLNIDERLNVIIIMLSEYVRRLNEYCVNIENLWTFIAWKLPTMHVYCLDTDYQEYIRKFSLYIVFKCPKLALWDSFVPCRLVTRAFTIKQTPFCREIRYSEVCNMFQQRTDVFVQIDSTAYRNCSKSLWKKLSPTLSRKKFAWKKLTDAIFSLCKDQSSKFHKRARFKNGLIH